LAERLDQTVLLGDPGGGKTTAANVLANFFASDAGRRLPFLVTLRDYAAKTPPEWSVVGYIEQTLNTLYQCHTLDGLVERLLLTGQAVVIFDGLDELLDTSRRRKVSELVEQFCSAFPLTQVLVTARVVGYNQARLDDTQFDCYRLVGFGDDKVTEYVGKWFATQENTPRAETEAKAAAFLNESTNAKDLRANPLLLSLMCILYRGAGSLPGQGYGQSS
jgi:predicted NACHT family NTPase